MPTLTITELQELGQFNDNNDPAGYYQYLVSKGSGYAELALGAVTNTGLPGLIANNFMDNKINGVRVN